MSASHWLALAVALAASSAAADPAYVLPGASGGSLDDASDPYPSHAAALAAGADELRIAEGDYAGDLNATADLVVRTWNGLAGPDEVLDIPAAISLDGDLSVGAGATLLLGGSGSTLTLDGDIDVAGTLDVGENTLEQLGGSPSRFIVQGSGEVAASEATGRTASRNHAGSLRFIGADDTEVFIETSAGRLRFDFPAIDVEKPSGNIDIDGNGGGTFAPHGWRIGPPGGAPEVTVGDGIETVEVEVDLVQSSGTFTFGSRCSTGERTVRTGGALDIRGGTFDAGSCSTEVGGDFTVGDGSPGAADALFSLGFGGTHTVVGDFTVAEDGDYRQGFGDAFLSGDFTFLGVADGAGSGNTGIFGDVFFEATERRTCTQRPSPDAYLDDVILNGPGGIRLLTDCTQNQFGVLVLENGVIDASDEAFDWIILNPGIEPDLSVRNNSQRGQGVVQLGSRDSYVNGSVAREVRFGNSGGGIVTGGYLFPIGADAERVDGDEVDFFRPLILQFADDLGASSVARVDYLEEVPDGADTTPVSDGALTLDAIGEAFWQLEFDRVPSFDPNVRVATNLAEVFGTPGGRRVPFDPDLVRLVQWDCDGQNPRLAGTWGGDDPASAMRNAEIDGLRSVSQTGVEAAECSLFALATSSDNLPDPPPPTAADGDPDAATTLALAAPNPSRGDVRIGYALGAAADVRLTVFDALGRAVRVLDAGRRTVGDHAARWDGRDGSGRMAAAGVYVVRLEAGGVVRTRRIVRL